MSIFRRSGVDVGEGTPALPKTQLPSPELTHILPPTFVVPDGFSGDDFGQEEVAQAFAEGVPPSFNPQDDIYVILAGEDATGSTQGSATFVPFIVLQPEAGGGEGSSAGAAELVGGSFHWGR